MNNINNATTPSAKRGSGLPHGSETIIVVEDDELVRNLSTRVLDSLGYSVISAEDGVVAYELARNHPTKVDLVFSDVVMPGCYGPEFVSRLRQVRNDFEVLYTSGYRRDAFDGHDQEQIVELLPKPFTPVQLANRVREVLDEAHQKGASPASSASDVSLSA